MKGIALLEVLIALLFAAAASLVAGFSLWRHEAHFTRVRIQLEKNSRDIAMFLARPDRCSAHDIGGTRFLRCPGDDSRDIPEHTFIREAR